MILWLLACIEPLEREPTDADRLSALTEPSFCAPNVLVIGTPEHDLRLVLLAESLDEATQSWDLRVPGDRLTAYIEAGVDLPDCTRSESVGDRVYEPRAGRLLWTTDGAHGRIQLNDGLWEGEDLELATPWFEAEY